ncbi:MAG: translation initiation factor IF-3 [Candidatus Pacebacteria bacterium CG1_02_43_31]|nr:MAG: translation initiation factor IF-3 [Candidatus Pacebacteria bacterium CG1_02_43_31]
MVGVMSRDEALTQARDAGKDLVLINEKATPPIVKIIDLAKFKYQEQQKKSQSRKTAKIQSIKEVRLTPFMSDGDFISRLNKVSKFLKKGDKVRLTLLFKGRAITKKEFGYDIFERAIEATKEYSIVEVAPKMMGKKLMAQLMPIPSRVQAKKGITNEKN